MSASAVIARASLDGAIVSVRVEGGVITHVGRRVPGADATFDADGGAVLPGLHDHHIHLLALAAARRSIRLGPPDVTDAAGLDRAVRAAAVNGDDDGGGWLRAVGYHESVGGALDRSRLDALVGDRPARVQHATGAMWVLSSAALTRTRIAELGLDGVERDAAGSPTGRCFGLDAELRALVPPAPLDLAGVGRDLVRCGVTGVTDLTPTDDPAEVDLLAAAVAAHELPLDVHVTGGLALPDGAGSALPRGAVKFVVGDHRLPELDALATGIRAAHRRGRPAAVHCASLVALVLALAAWDVAGVRDGDRIEHGAVIPAELLARLRDLELVVVTQPSFVRDRGDRYLADVPADEHASLWRCGSLVAAGVGVAAGTDAPYGDADPWRAIAAATDRRTAAGAVLGVDEAIDPAVALGLFLTAADDPAGPARRIAVGRPARLCVLDRPLPAALAAPEAHMVRAVVGPTGLLDVT
jgi:predicted amidohydrolase YtcJ